jgi:predicted glycosyltransferase
VELASKPRVALYSHDAAGLGHVRRNLLIASTLAASGHDVLLVSGSPEATSMVRPPGIDLVTLPALCKAVDGSYTSRHLSLGLDELLQMRRNLLTSALTSFAPDLLLVDRHARGFRGELEPALDRLRDTKVVLGLRDVLDAPDRVRAEWHHQRTGQALDAWYDEIWHYGDARLYHPLHGAEIVPPVPVLSTGYLVGDRPAPAIDRGEDADGEPFALCMVGGGSDGHHLADAVLDAVLPPGLTLLVVTGPQMAASDRQRLTARAAHRDEVTIAAYLANPERLLRSARAAMVMGGYNTICELLASRTPALVVPRDRPRLEQTVRADALCTAGVFTVLPPADATGRRIGDWLADAVQGQRPTRRAIDRDGLSRIADRTRALLASSDRRPLATSDDDVARTLTGATAPSDEGVTRAAV